MEQPNVLTKFNDIFRLFVGLWINIIDIAATSDKKRILTIVLLFHALNGTACVEIGKVSQTKHCPVSVFL